MNYIEKLMKFSSVALRSPLWIALAFAMGATTQANAEISALRGNSADLAWVERLATRILECGEQPVIVKRSGKLIYRPVRSRCSDVVISQDSVHFHMGSGSFTVQVQPNEHADGNDLNDVFLLYNDREDQSVVIAQAVLSFGDPALALVKAAGHGEEELRQVLRKKY